MVKASWGTKRTCQNCAARFYDLNKAPIKCPKCGREHDREDFVKVRRGRQTAAATAAAAAAVLAAAGFDAVLVGESVVTAGDPAAAVAALRSVEVPGTVSTRTDG